MPLGMTLFLRAASRAVRVPLAREFRDSLLAAIASRAGLPDEGLTASPAPFSLSCLMPAGAGTARPGKAPNLSGAPSEGQEGAPFRLRFAWLADRGIEAIEDWARGLQAEPLEVETDLGRVHIEGASVSSALAQRWNRSVSYGRLYEEASDGLREVTLKFYTVTTLEKRGRPYPLPDPWAVFLGYARLWDRFAGIPLPSETGEALRGSLQVADFRIRSRRAETDTGLVPGFVGSTTFRMQGRHPESVLKALNVLADYAFFCGTGIGTDRGMGLTRRIPG